MADPHAIEIPGGYRADLDLGDGHFARFFAYEPGGPRSGALIYHRRADGRGGICCSGVVWAPVPGDPDGPCWTLMGSPDEHLSLEPSIHCLECGDHGFVRDGRWVVVR